MSAEPHDLIERADAFTLAADRLRADLDRQVEAYKARQGVQEAAGGDETATAGGEDGRRAADAAGRRWVISKARPGDYYDKPWDAIRPGDHRAFPHATHAEALAYVNDQIRADALTAIQNQEARQ